MYAGYDFSPIDSAESTVNGFDFANDIPAGNTVVSAVVTVTNAPDTQVVDPAPSSRFVAGPFVSGTQVTFRMASGVAGVKYLIQAVATTNAAEQYSLFSHMLCESVV